MTKSSSIHRVPSAGGVEHGYPQGHLGHLTASEEQALKDFKVFLQEKRAWTPGPPPSHDDPTLLRYLRARKWVVQDAYGQFSETEKFRSANEIDVLYDTIDVDAYETSKKLVSLRNETNVAKYEKSTDTTYSSAKTDGTTPAKLLRLFALYENLTRFAQPLCTQCTDRENAETPITLSTNIVDISQVSLRMFWNLKSHMQAASMLATAHYPETLDRIFIIGAPAFFSTVWGWVKRWFDPVTVSKIFILGPDDVLPVLTSFIDIKNIPKAYGGEMDWKFFEEPKFDDEVKRLMSWENGYTALPPGPMYWRPYDDGKRLELMAVGTKDKKQRMDRVATIPVAFPNHKFGEDKAVAPAAPADAAPTTTTTNGGAPKTVDATAVDLNKLSINEATKGSEGVESNGLSEKTATDTVPPKETTTVQ
ncbi:hypothetical protein PG993_003325 [Apiospora rasikravindrae]|uniref:CRAL-TRIO domain-containing protein n=1 Tax=Apiospora rasikravindrae TaxID=990691 RepID=A0ABR1TZ84_9PEZI